MPRKSKRSGGEAMEELLALIAEAGRHCREIERQFGDHPAPELELVIKLHRVLLLQYTLAAKHRPEALKKARELMRPVMEWAALEEKRKQRELAEQKYRDQVEAEKAAGANRESGGLRPETLQVIERELSLL